MYLKLHELINNFNLKILDFIKTRKKYRDETEQKQS